MVRPSASIPKQFKFEQPKSPPVVVNFETGQVTYDIRLSLIAEIDRKLQITSQVAQCFQNYPSGSPVSYGRKPSCRAGLPKAKSS